jgi:hypothetical protein
MTFIAGGNHAYSPRVLSYSSIVAHGNIHSAFLVAALHNLDMLAINVGNVFLNAYTKVKVHTTYGMEFGEGLVQPGGICLLAPSMTLDIKLA